MKSVVGLLFLITLNAQEPVKVEVSVRTDLPCKLIIDGKPHGVIQPTAAFRITLSVGEHEFEAIPAETAPSVAGLKWQDTLDITGSESRTVEVRLAAAMKKAAIQKRGYWIDSATKFMWAASDNGSGLSLHQATRYCSELRSAGFDDWRMPTIDELQSLVGKAPDTEGRRIISPLKLTGWAWSSTPGREAGEGWALDFGDGGRASVVAGDSGLNRALCVRQTN